MRNKDCKLATVHGATVILSAAKDLGRVNARAISFAALRMTGTLPRYERLPKLQIATILAGWLLLIVAPAVRGAGRGNARCAQERRGDGAA